MKQIFDQLLQLLQQGIAAIFRFVQLVWTWSIDQVNRVFQAPWDIWPLWKQILLVIVIAAVIFVLFRAAVGLWLAGMRVLRAFAGLLVAFVMMLPVLLLAGVIAMGGLWAVNNLSFSRWPTFTTILPDNGQSGPTTNDTVGRGGSRAGEDRGNN